MKILTLYCTSLREALGQPEIKKDKVLPNMGGLVFPDVFPDVINNENT